MRPRATARADQARKTRQNRQRGSVRQPGKHRSSRVVSHRHNRRDVIDNAPTVPYASLGAQSRSLFSTPITSPRSRTQERRSRN